MEDPLGTEAAHFDEKFVEGSGGWHLRTLVWTPKVIDDAKNRPVVVIPGWTSVVEGWIPLLADWVRHRPVIYIETREKNYTKSPDGHRERAIDHSIPNHALDMDAIVRNLGHDPSECDWFASSLGSTSILHGLKEGTLSVRTAFLLAPNSEFKFPLWMVFLSGFPWWVYPPIMRMIAIPYMRWKVKEPGQKIRYTRTMRNADMRRLKLSTRSNRAYSVWDGLQDVAAPIAICVAKSDVLHAHDDAIRIADTLENGEVIEVVSNQFAHEAEIRPIIEEWITRVTE